MHQDVTFLLSETQPCFEGKTKDTQWATRGFPDWKGKKQPDAMKGRCPATTCRVTAHSSHQVHGTDPTHEHISPTQMNTIYRTLLAFCSIHLGCWSITLMQTNIFQGFCFKCIHNVKEGHRPGTAPGRGELHQMHPPSKRLIGQSVQRGFRTRCGLLLSHLGGTREV